MDNVTSLFFLSAAAFLLLLERFTTLRRAAAAPIQYRWITNIGLMFFSGIVLAILFPANITEIAIDLEGGLIRDLGLPLVLESVLVLLVLDCFLYWEHRAFHEIPLLWRMHLVHHSDTSVDVTTAERHHPLEKIITTFIAIMLMFALGFSVESLAVYLLVATLFSLFTHANITLPEYVDRPLRRWLVTPTFHAVHHSSYQPETDSNYGSILTIWDHLFGTSTDPASARIPRFGLDYFRQPHHTTLISALVQPFEYPKNGTPTEINEAPTLDAHVAGLTLSPEWRQALWFGGFSLVIALAALWPTVVELALLWSHSDSYQYAWLVPPMFIYILGWHHRERILAMTPAPSYGGLALIFAALLLWLIAFLADIKLGRQVSLVLVLQGIAICAFGWKIYRNLLPVMLFLFLMLPCGDVLLPLLQSLTVKWVEWFALLTGLPCTVDGYYVQIGEHEYIVIEDCAGLALFTLSSFLGYSFGLLLFRSLTKVLLMAALGAILGILTNALRVCAIISVDWWRDSQMDLAGHTDIQWLVLAASLGLLLYLASKLHQDTWALRSDDLRNNVTSCKSLTRFAPLVAALGLIATIGITHGVTYRGVKSASSAEALQQLAASYSGSYWTNEVDGGRKSLIIPYQNKLDAVLVAPEPGSIRIDDQSSLDGPSGWMHLKTATFQDCCIADCIKFEHKTWKKKEANDFRHVIYAYYVDNLITNSKLVFRLASGWNRLAGKPGLTGLIGFRLQGDLPPEFSPGNIFRDLKSNWQFARSGFSRFPWVREISRIETVGCNDGRTGAQSQVVNTSR